MAGSIDRPLETDARIVCAAIRNADGDIICGPRHFDGTMHRQITLSGADWTRAEQGFVDQRGNFFNRMQAFVIAFDAGQIRRSVGGDTANGGTLYSENLY